MINPIQLQSAPFLSTFFNRRSIDYARFDSSLVSPGQSGGRHASRGNEFQETATR